MALRSTPHAAAIAKLGATSAKLEAAIAKLGAAIAKLEAAIAKLEAAIAKLEAAVAKLGAVAPTLPPRQVRSRTQTSSFAYLLKGRDARMIDRRDQWAFGA